jgi:hypothetical protein
VKMMSPSMPIIHLGEKTHQVLNPDDLRLAAEAFEAALQQLDESTCGVHPYAARKLLARYIIEKTFSGDREPGALREGALAYLKQAPPPAPR